MFLADVHGLGLRLAQGFIVTESFYWDLNDKTRALGKRFLERTNRCLQWSTRGPLEKSRTI
jgi:branched-chain amino acid transport system substrate-binding protein